MVKFFLFSAWWSPISPVIWRSSFRRYLFDARFIHIGSSHWSRQLGSPTNLDRSSKISRSVSVIVVLYVSGNQQFIVRLIPYFVWPQAGYLSPRRIHSKTMRLCLRTVLTQRETSRIQLMSCTTSWHTFNESQDKCNIDLFVIILSIIPSLIAPCAVK